jgi:TnpA family transposase
MCLVEAHCALTFAASVSPNEVLDAVVLLQDEILGNTTELPIAEHTTDSHGQTLATFALFDLVGLRLSPRIAKLTEKQLWRPHPASHYQRWPHAGPLLGHHLQGDLGNTTELMADTSASADQERRLGRNQLQALSRI